MECFIVQPDDVRAGELVLCGDEAHHALRSLRLKHGEEIIATDLAGTCYHAVLVGSHEEKNEMIAECKILQALPEHHEPKHRIILAQAILSQPSRFEDILEKATELGVSSFIPLITERTEKKQINRKRLERILREATKQVSRARMPILHEPMNLSHALSASQGAIVLHEAVSQDNHISNVLTTVESYPLTLFIGPEGGFTEEEIAQAQSQSAIIASLGARRLRAETAAIAAVAIVSHS